MLSLNTLLLCRQILGERSVSVNADREQANAVYDARDELDIAIAELAPAEEPAPLNRAQRRATARQK